MLGIIVQARLGSTRLPNKMTLPFHENLGVLEIILNKIKNNLTDIPLVVATTTAGKDDAIVGICRANNIDYYRGSEENVLSRFIETAEKYNFSKIIRVCADNPFLDITYLKELIVKFNDSNLDYLSYKTSKDKPTILTHYGFWTEAVSLEALKSVLNSTKDALYLEHVTNYIHSTLNNFNMELIQIPIEIEKVENLRLTLDTEGDYKLLKEIYTDCQSNSLSTSLAIVKFIEQNKGWLSQMKEQIKLNTK